MKICAIFTGEIIEIVHTWSANRPSRGKKEQVYVRVDLRNYGEIDPEMKIEGFEWYVSAKTEGCQSTRACSDAGYVPSILPFVAERIGCQSPIRFFHHQNNRIENSRNSSRSEHSGPYDTVRGREIVRKYGR